MESLPRPPHPKPLLLRTTIRSHGSTAGEAAASAHTTGTPTNIYLRVVRSTKADFKETTQIMTGIERVTRSRVALLSPTEPICFKGDGVTGAEGAPDGAAAASPPRATRLRALPRMKTLPQTLSDAAVCFEEEGS